DDLARQLRTLAPDRVGVECSGSELAYVTDRNDPVVRALSNAIRESGTTPRPKRKTGTADLNVVGPVWGCPIAAYGPGDSSLDHTPHERLALVEYDRSVGVLSRALCALGLELLEHRAATAPLQQGSVPA
ncbi:MAG: M20/M25/M40 family metallo-hydrolase, partial [Phycisphaerales bacterium JB041]